MIDMRSIRDIKLKARRDLHERMKVPAYYISAIQGVAPRVVTVRLHSKFDALGALTGDKDWAERKEIKPRIVMMIDQISNPRESGYFCFSKEEVYQIGPSEPADNITITAECTLVKPAKALEITLDLAFPITVFPVYQAPTVSLPVASDWIGLIPTRQEIEDAAVEAVRELPALPIPAYLIADLPSAVTNSNSTVLIIDNPQGQASSNGTVWISDVDGSNLGPGSDG